VSNIADTQYKGERRVLPRAKMQTVSNSANWVFAGLKDMESPRQRRALHNKSSSVTTMQFEAKQPSKLGRDRTWRCQILVPPSRLGHRRRVGAWSTVLCHVPPVQAFPEARHGPQGNEEMAHSGVWQRSARLLRGAVHGGAFSAGLGFVVGLPRGKS
jgi:hypothetical protein